METLDALHNPDLKAGGNDVVNDLGDSRVNQSIGSQWGKGGRIDELDKAAQKVPEAEQGSTKMNVKLKSC
jgi:hypothetical protein